MNENEQVPYTHSIDTKTSGIISIAMKTARELLFLNNFFNIYFERWLYNLYVETVNTFTEN